MVDRDWDHLARRAERTPDAAGEAWFAFSRPTLLEEAWDVPPGVRLTAVLFVYPERQGRYVKGEVPVEPGASVDDVVAEVVRSRSPNPIDEAVWAGIERGDVPLGAVRVAGRWADLGAFGSDCQFYSAQPLEDWPVLSPLVAPE